MARCGCSSAGASGAVIANTPCVTTAGAGTPSSPFLLSPKIDPNITNVLTCGAAGLLVPNPDNPGAWTGYIPSWQGAGSPEPDVGNGYLYGIYRRRGRSLELLISLVFGSTTDPGGYVWRWYLPGGMTAAFPAPVPAHVRNNITGEYYPAAGLVNVGNNYIELMSDHAGRTGTFFGAGAHIIMSALLYLNP